MQVLTLPGYVSKHLTAFYFQISSRVFCTLFICLVFSGLLKSICFRMFCSKHLITFEITYLLSCWFHCVDKFYKKFRFHETHSNKFRDLLIKRLSKFRAIKCWFNLYTHVCFRFVWIQMFCIARLVFLHFTFHWYLHGSK